MQGCTVSILLLGTICISQLLSRHLATSLATPGLVRLVLTISLSDKYSPTSAGIFLV